MLQHITLILPIAYRGGSLRVAKTIARMIRRASSEAGTPCGVRLAVIEGKYDLGAEFRDLRDDGIEVREFTWDVIDRRKSETISLVQNRPTSLPFDEYQVPSDGMNDLMDSDLWLVVSDRLERPLAPIKPYVVFATDYIQRYVPEIFPEGVRGKGDIPFLHAARLAAGVITTTPQTRLDAISYAGVPASRLRLAAMDFDPTWIPKLQPSRRKGPRHIIWPTNPTQHKNHDRAFDALIKYYEELGGALDVRIVGPNSRWMDPTESISPQVEAIKHVREVRSKISRSSTLQERVLFSGELSDYDYASALTDAAFLWHPTIYDNGTFAVAEAAWCKCPSLSSGYPQMRYIGERFSIPMKFFNARSVGEMAEALKDMETEAASLREQLPSREALSMHSWERHAPEYWTMLCGIVAQ